MTNISANENLELTGFVADIFKFDNFQEFNIELLNSMFHFETRDRKRETDLIVKIATKIEKGGMICICIQDTSSKVKILKGTITSTKLGFKVLADSSLIYKYEDKESGQKSETKYLMHIVKRL